MKKISCPIGNSRQSINISPFLLFQEDILHDFSKFPQQDWTPFAHTLLSYFTFPNSPLPYIRNISPNKSAYIVGWWLRFSFLVGIPWLRRCSILKTNCQEDKGIITLLYPQLIVRTYSLSNSVSAYPTMISSDVMTLALGGEKQRCLNMALNFWIHLSLQANDISVYQHQGVGEEDVSCLLFLVLWLA